MLNKIAYFDCAQHKSPKRARKVETQIMFCGKVLRGSHRPTWQSHDAT